MLPDAQRHGGSEPTAGWKLEGSIQKSCAKSAEPEKPRQRKSPRPRRFTASRRRAPGEEPGEPLPVEVPAREDHAHARAGEIGLPMSHGGGPGDAGGLD